MFKSVFAKYFMTFMVIILVCFAVLGLIFSFSTTANLQNIKKETMISTRDTLVSYLNDSFKASKTADFGAFVYYTDVKTTVNSVISAVNQDIFVIICGDTGVVQLPLAAPDEIALGTNLDTALLSSLKSSKIQDSNTTLEFTGENDSKEIVYSSKMLISSGTVNDSAENTVGLVLVCSKSASLNGALGRTIKSMLIPMLWVIAAALITVFFITDKIVSPIKNMSEAAKSFSQGKFDVRVPVKGKDEVAELAAALNDMAETLEKNDDTRKTFLANVSHDLRTPMTTISGFIDNILSGAIPYEKQNYYLQIVSTEVKRLARLVNSLLDISRIQAGDRKFVPAPFDICEMSRQIIISLEQRLEDKKLDVRFEAEQDKMMVSADRDAIYQVLYNLCDNAVKFSKEGGIYKISHIERDGKIYTAVYNEGQGIAKEELPMVFDRFYKSDKSRGLDKTGVGLGLYIVKTIITSHGEEIWVNSVYGEYCEFVFTLTPAEQNKKQKDKEQQS